MDRLRQEKQERQRKLSLHVLSCLAAPAETEGTAKTAAEGRAAAEGKAEAEGRAAAEERAAAERNAAAEGKAAAQEDGLAKALLDQGFGSAWQIQAVTEREFISRCTRRMNLDAERARTIHRRAVSLSRRAAHLFTELKTTAGSAYYRGMKAANVSESARDFFGKMPDYQDVFGVLEDFQGDFSDTVFSPAAYLVDLLRIVEKYITPQAEEGHRLQARRPDLWKIELNQKNTEEEMPYLQIINERLTAVLEEALAKRKDTRPVDQVLCESVYPFCLPMDRPLAAVRAWLWKQGVGPEELAETGRRGEDDLLSARLGMNEWLWKDLLAPFDDAKRRKYLGQEEGTDGRRPVGNAADEPDFSAWATYDAFRRLLGMDETDIRELIYQNLRPEDFEKLPMAVSAKEDETLTGRDAEIPGRPMTASVKEGEMAACPAQKLYLNKAAKEDGYLDIRENEVKGLCSAVMDRLVPFVRFAKGLGLSYDRFDWLLRLAAGEPEYESALTQEALWFVCRLLRVKERYFLSWEDLVCLAGPLKAYGRDEAFDRIWNAGEGKPYHPADGGPVHPGYRDDIIILAREGEAAWGSWAAKLGLKKEELIRLWDFLSGAGSLELSYQNLSALCRHVRLQRLLGISQEEYFLLAGGLKLNRLQAFTPEEIDAVFSWKAYVGPNAYIASYVLTGQESAYAKKRYTQEAMKAFLANRPDQAAGDRDKRREAAENSIARFFRETPELVKQLTNFLPALPRSLEERCRDWFDAFDFAPKEEQKEEWTAYQKAVLDAFSRWIVLVQAGFPAKFAELAGRGGSYYGVEDWQQIGWQDFHILYRMKDRWQQEPEIYEKLQNAYAAAGGRFLPEDFKRILEWEETQEEIGAAIEGLQGERPCLTAEYVWSYRKMQQKLGIKRSDVGQLTDMYKMDYHRQAALARMIVGDTKPDGIHTQMRRALLGLVQQELSRQYADLDSPDKVYQYLLMDVEMEEAVTISYIKEALNAVQLYLCRCRMGLEPGVDTADIPENWWSWLLNYRMWEANRQIFVYPENYLLPETRNTKSGQFTELENALRQARPEDGYVRSQYIKYLTEYDNLTQLCPCAAYRTRINGRDVLYLFGRTKHTPYAYYFCTQTDGEAWSQWEKIDVKINAEYITPVYAFHRLYLFWVEPKNLSRPQIGLSGENIKSSEQKCFQVDVKYTFRSLEGDFILPQVLIQDELVYLKEEGGGSEEEAHTFDMERECWKRLSALRITKKNFEGETVPFFDMEEDYERLLISFGSFWGDFSGQMEQDVAVKKECDDIRLKYEARKAARTNQQNILRLMNYSGHVQTGFARLFNREMEEDFLVTPQEFYLFDEYSARRKNMMLLPRADAVTNRVGLTFSRDILKSTMEDSKGVLSRKWAPGPVGLKKEDLISCTVKEELAGNVIKHLEGAAILSGGRMEADDILDMDFYGIMAEDYQSGKKEIPPGYFAQLHESLLNQLGSLTLFDNGQNSSIMPVFNQPGEFLYTCMGETFLISPEGEGAAFSGLEESVRFSFPRFTSLQFRELGYDLTQCNAIWNRLTDREVLDMHGYINYAKTGRESLTEIFRDFSEVKVDVEKLYHVLHDRQVATGHMFVDEHTDRALSEEIFKALAGSGVIKADADEGFLYARVDEKAARGVSPKAALGSFAADRRPQQLADWYVRCLQAPAAVGIRYENREKGTGEIDFAEPEDLKKLSYQALRMTNASVKSLKDRIYLGGVEEFLSLKTQEIPVIPVLHFNRLKPDPSILKGPRALDGTQVDFEGLYREYNWELFYHIPVLIAESLRANQLFEQAKRWLEFIFRPGAKPSLLQEDGFARKARAGYFSLKESAQIFRVLTEHGIIREGRAYFDFTKSMDEETREALLEVLETGGADREEKLTVIENILRNESTASDQAFYWQFLPFRQMKMETLVENLKENSPAMRVYNNDPFHPHAIAGLRPGAYQKYVLMEYIRLLIDWGDMEFGKYTWESLTTATMMYVMALGLLGPRPVMIPSKGRRNAATFAQIQEKYKEIPQFLLALEDLLAQSGQEEYKDMPVSQVPCVNIDCYFAIPENSSLIALWDLAEDRLYKIRNCMDLEGNIRKPALYEQAVNPLNLAKMAAADNQIELPGDAGEVQGCYYRFSYLLEQARQLAGSLIQLGRELEIVLEHSDSMKLQVLRNTQEAALDELMISIKQAQADEMEAAIEALEFSKANAAGRKEYYKQLSEEWMSASETLGVSLLGGAGAAALASAAMKMAAGGLRLAPQVGSPFAMKYGGVELGSSMDAFGGAMDAEGMFLMNLASCTFEVAGYERRREEWKQLSLQAAQEESSLERQMKAARARYQAARRELDLQKKERENKQRVADFYESRFTGGQLYQWMAGSLKAVMLKTYQLALETAWKAQTAYQQEYNSNETFLGSQYWNGAAGGLLSGELLLAALEQMQMAKLRYTKRLLNVEKTVSLAMDCPQAFAELQVMGKCRFTLSEQMFDLDYPGMYLRKIKSVAVSVPAVLGPYGTVKAIMTQEKNAILTSPGEEEALRYMLDGFNGSGETPRGVILDLRSGQRIALSRGINDRGIFEMDQQEETYLPFEGTGAVSGWTLEMPKTANRMDYQNISDVLIHIQYTGLESAGHRTLVNRLLSERTPRIRGLYVNLRQRYPEVFGTLFKKGTEEAEVEFSIDSLPLCGEEQPFITGILIQIMTPLELTGTCNLFTLYRPGDGREENIAADCGIGACRWEDYRFSKELGTWKLKIHVKELAESPGYEKLWRDGCADEATLLGIQFIVITEGKV